MSSSNARKNPYLQWYYQHKTLVWGAAATAVTLYATYKVTASASASSRENDGVEERPRRQESQFQRLRKTLKNYSQAASTCADIAALVSEDLQTFLTSDSSELPQSLRQLNKLLQAPELQETVSTVTASVVRGVSKATGVTSAPDARPLVDTIIEAVLSERGRGLVGMAVGVAMRNSTTAVCEFIERRMEAAASSSSGGGVPNLSIKDILDLLASDQGEKVLTMLLTQSIRTAVTSYVDATAGYNLYNDMLASLVKQEHRDALTDLLSRISASFCREAVLSYRRGMATGTAPGSFSGGSGASSSHAANHNMKHGVAANMASTNTPTAPAGTTASCTLPAACVAMASSSASQPEASGGSVDARSSVLPNSKSNGLTRVSQGSQLYKQQSLGVGGLLSSASGNSLTMALGRSLTSQTPPAWLRQVVELIKEREVRSLAVDVVKHASREATRGAVEGLLQGKGLGADVVVASAPSGVLVLPPSMYGYRLFVVATLAVSLCAYALSPRVMLL